MHDAWLPPFQWPRSAPRWVLDLKEIDTILKEQAKVTAQLVPAIADALAGHDLGGLSVEQWLRVLLVQQTSRCDDREMGIRLNDSRVCRAFCGLVDEYVPAAAIRANLRALDETTWIGIEPVLRSHLGATWKKRYRERLGG